MPEFGQNIEEGIQWFRVEGTLEWMNHTQSHIAPPPPL